ncbi:MAG: nucleotide exchange factor GrpE [Planctomycetota bacterium]
MKSHPPQDSSDKKTPKVKDVELEDLINIKEDGDGPDLEIQSSKLTDVDPTNAEGLEILDDPDDLISQLQNQVVEAEKRVLLAQADLENVRRRTRRDAADKVKFASLGLMNEILDAVDNLQRAVDAYQLEPNGDGLVEGVRMVAGQINAALANHGCKKIEAVGQPFDPNLHQALQMQPSEDFPANTVMMNLRAGYQLHERVVRHSQVFVSTGQPKSDPKNPTED